MVRELPLTPLRVLIDWLRVGLIWEQSEIRQLVHTGLPNSFGCPLFCLFAPFSGSSVFSVVDGNVSVIVGDGSHLSCG